MINMNAFNDNGNIKQFKLTRLINENCADEHVVTKMSIVLRRDKIEAPYYMVTKIKVSSCIDNESGGLVHAMDMMSLNRMHNLSEDAYHEIESLIDDACESDAVKVTSDEKGMKMAIMSKSNSESISLFENYRKLFERIDNLIC